MRYIRNYTLSIYRYIIWFNHSKLPSEPDEGSLMLNVVDLLRANHVLSLSFFHWNLLEYLIYSIISPQFLSLIISLILVLTLPKQWSLALFNWVHSVKKCSDVSLMFLQYLQYGDLLFFLIELLYNMPLLLLIAHYCHCYC